MAAALREGAAVLRGEVGAWTTTFDEPSASEMCKQLREKLDLSPFGLAVKLGVRERRIRDWESGRSRPRGAAYVLLRIAHARPEALEYGVPKMIRQWRPPKRWPGKLPEWARKRPPAGSAPMEVAREILAAPD